MPIHALFATGAVHHALIDAGLRCRANLVIETGSARDPHQIASLVGYGAAAVYPYPGLPDHSGHDRAGLIQADPVNAAQLPQGHQQGPVEGAVQDGDFHHRQLPWRPAV